MRWRAQVSLEYMILFGFLMFVITVLILVSNTISVDSRCSIVAQQVARTAKSIVQTTEEIYYFGPPSKTEFSVLVPEEVSGDFLITNTSDNYYMVIPFNCKYQQNYSESFNVPVGGEISGEGGNRRIQIEAKRIKQGPPLVDTDLSQCIMSDVLSDDPSRIGEVFSCIDGTV